MPRWEVFILFFFFLVRRKRPPAGARANGNKEKVGGTIHATDRAMGGAPHLGALRPWSGGATFAARFGAILEGVSEAMTSSDTSPRGKNRPWKEYTPHNIRSDRDFLPVRDARPLRSRHARRRDVESALGAAGFPAAACARRARALVVVCGTVWPRYTRATCRNCSSADRYLITVFGERVSSNE